MVLWLAGALAPAVGQVLSGGGYAAGSPSSIPGAPAQLCVAGWDREPPDLPCARLHGAYAVPGRAYRGVWRCPQPPRLGGRPLERDGAVEPPRFSPGLEAAIHDGNAALAGRHAGVVTWFGLM